MAPAPAPAPAPATPASSALRPLPEQVAELERRAMAAALQATRGNRMAAARLLRISRAAFYDKLARYPELAAGLAADTVVDGPELPECQAASLADRLK